MFRYRGSAGEGDIPALAKISRGPSARTRGGGWIAGRVLLSGKVEAIPDRLEDPEFTVPPWIPLTEHAARSILGVPLLRNDRVEGALILTRREARAAFTPRQIEIVETFADQAVIAISNVGLFNETQESLAQQTATADVLKVISCSVLRRRARLRDNPQVLSAAAWPRVGGRLPR